MLQFELPYPPRILNPNGRAHPIARNRSAQKAKRDAYLVAQAAARGITFKPKSRLRVLMEFRTTTSRGRDKDNCLASMKPSLDGIAIALGMNDSRFDPVVEIPTPRRGVVPSVLVTITETS